MSPYLGYTPVDNTIMFFLALRTYIRSSFQSFLLIELRRRRGTTQQ